MKKDYFFKFFLLLIPATALILMSNSEGVGTGKSGSPGDGGITCAQCHFGGDFNASATILSDIPSSGYLFNTTYTINVATSSNASTLGFQLTAENSDNTKIGVFTAGTGSKVINKRVTHSGTSTSGNWSFNWTSPSSDEGNVTFYTAVNAANGNTGTSGDQIVTANSTPTSLSISEAKRLNFGLFPNPASDNVTIQLPSGTENATAQFYDYLGRLAFSEKVTRTNNKVAVHSLSKGVYILKVVTEDKIGSQKFVKN
jgi:hypothetical protein